MRKAPTPARADEARAPPPDALSREAARLTQSWARSELERWAQLLGRARTELQQELLCRALAARHSLEELEAFGRDIRRHSDSELYRRCNLAAGLAEDTRRSMRHRRVAEADPIVAYALSAPDTLGDAEAGALDAVPPPPLRPPVHPWLEDVLNLVIRPMGASYEEACLDPREGLVESTLARMAEALHRGLPVPALLADASGKPLQPVLFLQCEETAGRRRLQLHTLFSGETIWLDEWVLRSRESLPVQDGEGTGLSRICLPDESTLGRYGAS